MEAKKFLNISIEKVLCANKDGDVAIPGLLEGEAFIRGEPARWGARGPGEGGGGPEGRGRAPPPTVAAERAQERPELSGQGSLFRTSGGAHRGRVEGRFYVARD